MPCPGVSTSLGAGAGTEEGPVSSNQTWSGGRGGWSALQVCQGPWDQVFGPFLFLAYYGLAASIKYKLKVPQARLQLLAPNIQPPLTVWARHSQTPPSCSPITLTLGFSDWRFALTLKL